jgi:hypothetical protein
MKKIFNLTGRSTFYAYKVERLQDSQFSANLFFQNPERGNIIELSQSDFRASETENQCTLFEVTDIVELRDHAGTFNDENLRHNSYARVILRQLSPEEALVIREAIAAQTQPA